MKVLIIGQSFDRVTGGGITLTSLFGEWPEARIAVANASDFVGEAPLSERYYRLGSLEDRWLWPLSRIKRAENKRSGPVAPLTAPQETSQAALATPDHEPRRLRNSFYATIRMLGVEDVLHRLQVSPQFLDWVNDFGPDVIYSPVRLINQVRVTAQLVRATGIPLVIHVMDDWLSTAYRTGLLSFYLRRRLDIEFRALVDQASALLGISQLMCDAFAARYGRQFVPFHNPVDLAAWMAASKQNWNAHTPFRLCYAGTVGANNSVSSRDLCRAVAELRGAGHNVVLDMFIPNLTHAIANDLGQWEGITFQPGLPHSEMPAALGSADVLALPLDFDQESINAILYSMPTKAAEYMISGTPSLIYAPAGCAVAQYAQREGWGYVVRDGTIDALKEAIHKLMQDQALRERLGRCGQQLAIQNHDATQVRAAFRQILTSAAGKHQDV